MDMNRTIIALAFLLGLAPRVSAAESGDAKAQRAHFRRGQAEYRLAHFAKALKAYEAAYKAKHHPVILFNIAQCHRQLGHYKKALFFYKLYLEEWPQASNRALVERLMAKVRKALSEMGRLSVVSHPPGAKVYLDRSGGNPVGVTPVVLELRSGKHVLFLSFPNGSVVQRVVTITNGGLQTLDVSLPASYAQSPVGRLTIISDPPGAYVTVDEPTSSPLGKTPITLPLPAGQHVVFLDREGYQTVQRIVLVEAGKVGTIRVAMAPLARDVMALPTGFAVGVRIRGNPNRGRSLPWWVYAMYTTASASGAACIVLGIEAWAKYNDWKDGDRDPDEARTIHRMAVWTDVTLGVSAALFLGAGVSHYLYWRHRNRRDGGGKEKGDVESPPQASTQTTILPACGPSSCGILVRGRF